MLMLEVKQPSRLLPLPLDDDDDDALKL